MTPLYNWSKTVFMICCFFINGCYAPDDLIQPDTSKDDGLLTQVVIDAYTVISKALKWHIKPSTCKCHLIINTFNCQFDYEPLKELMGRNNNHIDSPLPGGEGTSEMLTISYSSSENRFFILCSNLPGYLSFESDKEFTLHKHEYTNADH